MTEYALQYARLDQFGREAVEAIIRAEYNRCISELEGFYRKELEKSKKCDEITIKYNSLIDIVNNFLKVQQGM